MNRSIAERIGIWLGIIALAVFLIDRMLVVVGFFASTLLMFASAWLIALVLEPIVRRITAAPLPMTPRRRRLRCMCRALSPCW